MALNDPRPDIVPRPMLYLQDETEYYDWEADADKSGVSGEELVRRCGGKIFAVYLFDESKHIHICSLTPAYEMEYQDSIPLVWPEDAGELFTLETDLEEVNSSTEQWQYFTVDYAMREMVKAAQKKNWDGQTAGVVDLELFSPQDWQTLLDDADGDEAAAREAAMAAAFECIHTDGRY